MKDAHTYTIEAQLRQRKGCGAAWVAYVETTNWQGKPMAGWRDFYTLADLRIWVKEARANGMRRVIR